MGADACGCLEKSSQLEMSCIQKECSSLVSGSRLDHSARVAYHKKREDAKCVFCPLSECHEFHVALPIPGSQRSYPSGSQRPARNQSTADTWCILFWAPFWVHFGLHCEFKWPRQSMTRKYTERKWYKPHIVASYYSTRMRQSGSCFVQPNPVHHTLIISHFNSTIFNHSSIISCRLTLRFNHTSTIQLALQLNHPSVNHLVVSHFNSTILR